MTIDEYKYAERANKLEAENWRLKQKISNYRFDFWVIFLFQFWCSFVFLRSILDTLK